MAATVDLHTTAWPAHAPALRSFPEARLVLLAQEGNDDAFAEIMRRHERDVRVSCARRIGDDHAHDVTQQAFLQALLALRRGNGPAAGDGVRPWLFVIARNCCVDHLRARGPETDELPAAFDGVPQPPQLAEDRDRVRRTVRMLHVLPDDQRRALVARELEGLSYEEISAELGTTDGSVRQLIFRARDHIRRSVAALIPLPRLLWMLRTNSEPATALLGRSAEPLAGCIALALINCAPLVATGGEVVRHDRAPERAAAVVRSAPAPAFTAAAAPASPQAAAGTTVTLRRETAAPRRSPSSKAGRDARRRAPAGRIQPRPVAAVDVPPAPAAAAPSAPVEVAAPVSTPPAPAAEAPPKVELPAVVAPQPAPVKAAALPQPVVTKGGPPPWSNAGGKGRGNGQRSTSVAEPAPAPAAPAPAPEPVAAPVAEPAPAPAAATPGSPPAHSNAGGKGKGRGRS